MGCVRRSHFSLLHTEAVDLPAPPQSVGRPPVHGVGEHELSLELLGGRDAHRPSHSCSESYLQNVDVITAPCSVQFFLERICGVMTEDLCKILCKVLNPIPRLSEVG